MRALSYLSYFLTALTLVAFIVILLFSKSRVSTVVSSDQPATWAVLVAGSQGWKNYRHQADVAHAYQLLRAGGVLKENIIVMMNDDIAFNEENTEPGVIRNTPGGPNVYEDLRIDYSGNSVTADNFQAVLLGQKSAGKVLQSGPNDNVVVYFSDHGGPGILTFPSGYIDAPTLRSTLIKMLKLRKFNQLLLLVEACMSGSMFDGFLGPDIPSIFAITSANATSESYACCRDNSTHVYMGDAFSVSLLDSLGEQLFQNGRQLFHLVAGTDDGLQNMTPQVHLALYGDHRLMKTRLSKFFHGKGKEPLNKTSIIGSKEMVNFTVGLDKTESKKDTKLFDQVMSYLAPSSPMDSSTFKPSITSQAESCYFAAVSAYSTWCQDIGRHSDLLAARLTRLLQLCTVSRTGSQQSEDDLHIARRIEHICAVEMKR